MTKKWFQFMLALLVALTMVSCAVPEEEEDEEEETATEQSQDDDQQVGDQDRANDDDDDMANDDDDGPANDDDDDMANDDDDAEEPAKLLEIIKESTTLAGAKGTVEHWASENGCTGDPAASNPTGFMQDDSTVEQQEYTVADNGCNAPVTLFSIHPEQADDVSGGAAEVEGDHSPDYVVDAFHNMVAQFFENNVNGNAPGAQTATEATPHTGEEIPCPAGHNDPPEAGGPTPEHDDTCWTLDVEGLTRNFWLHIPDGVGDNAPLAIMLHGVTSDSEWADRYMRARQFANDNNYIAVLPNGYKLAGNPYAQFWNFATITLPEGMELTSEQQTIVDELSGQLDQIDDVKFLNLIIDAMINQHNIDPSRVYLVGHSNGGIMTQMYACQNADRVAAFMSIAGPLKTPIATCEPAQPVPMVHVHDVLDPTVPYQAGTAREGLLDAVILFLLQEIDRSAEDKFRLP